MHLRIIGLTLACGLAAGCGTEVSLEEAGVGGLTEGIRDGHTTTTGQFDAVVRLPGCTGTLISDDTVLTAAHCVCNSSCPPVDGSCQSRTTVTFVNARRRSPRIREDVSMSGDVSVFPGFCQGGWNTNDYALITLDEKATDLLVVRPIQVAPKGDRLQIGEAATLVGYGGTHTGSGANCNDSSFGTKRYGTTKLDQYYEYGDPATSGTSLVFNDVNVGACKGDSGGPAINDAGKVVGVASTGNSSTNSNYDPTYIAYEWMAARACPSFEPGSPDWRFCDNSLCPCATSEGDCDTSQQCQDGNHCIQDIGPAVNAPRGMDLCWAEDQLVTLWDSTAFSGTRQSFPVGAFGVETFTRIGNDRVSSVSTAPGLTVRLCSENGHWGNCQKMAGLKSLSGNSLNNNASSLEVRPGVTVYDLRSFRGTNQTFEVGDHSVDAFSSISDDDITSLIASPGIRVRLCAEDGGGGDCQYYSGRVKHVGSVLNQRASNIEVEAGVTAYGDADFQGTSQTLVRGTHGASSLNVVGNDRISSLVVAPGLTAELCSENGAWGDCLVYEGWVPYVGDLLNDRTSSIRVY